MTEANLGDGTFPATRYLAAGGNIGIGTDSNILIDVAGELRALEYSQRLRDRRRAMLGSDAVPSIGERLFREALAGGARATGAATGIAVHQPADLFTLAADHTIFAGADARTTLDRWVFAAGSQAIDCVWRGGRKWVEGGRHVARDAIAARYRGVVAALLA